MERLRGNLQGLGGEAQNQHAIFLDTAEQVTNFNAASYFDTAPELVERAYNRPKIAALQAGSVIQNKNVDSRSMSRLAEKRKKKYREMTARKKRKAELVRVQEKLELQKKLMGKGRRTKIVVKDRYIIYILISLIEY